MSRPIRTVSPTGNYHIVVRGSYGIKLFADQQDSLFLIGLLSELAEETETVAYCLLPNELQLFLHERAEGEVPRFMQRLLTRYAGAYNRKYHRRGSITEGRYQCAAVQEGEEASLIRFIHQAPVRQKLCKTAAEYPHSSFAVCEYDRWFAEDAASFQSREEPLDFTIRPSGKLTDRQTAYQVGLFCEENGISDWKQLPKAERDEYLRLLRTRFSIGQLQTATGLSRGVIAGCTREKKSSSGKAAMESFLL